MPDKFSNAFLMHTNKQVEFDKLMQKKYEQNNSLLIFTKINKWLAQHVCCTTIYSSLLIASGLISQFHRI